MAVWRVKQVPMWTAEKLIRWFATIGWTEVQVVAPPQGPNAGWVVRGAPILQAPLGVWRSMGGASLSSSLAWLWGFQKPGGGQGLPRRAGGSLFQAQGFWKGLAFGFC
eukprot:15467500-Alexandrium_andersonii.AAC.1